MSEKFKIYLIVYPLAHTLVRNWRAVANSYKRMMSKAMENKNAILVTTSIPSELESRNILKDKETDANKEIALQNKHFYIKDFYVGKSKTPFAAIKEELARKNVRPEDIELVVKGEFMHICAARKAGRFARVLGLKPEQVRFKFKNMLPEHNILHHAEVAYRNFAQKYQGKIDLKRFVAGPYASLKKELLRTGRSAELKSQAVKRHHQRVRGKHYV